MAGWSARISRQICHFSRSVMTEVVISGLVLLDWIMAVRMRPGAHSPRVTCAGALIIQSEND